MILLGTYEIDSFCYSSSFCWVCHWYTRGKFTKLFLRKRDLLRPLLLCPALQKRRRWPWHIDIGGFFFFESPRTWQKSSHSSFFKLTFSILDIFAIKFLKQSELCGYFHASQLVSFLYIDTLYIIIFLLS